MALRKRTLLHEDVVNELYKLIDERQIKPGEKFPSETELAGKLGVSRNVLREAFHLLERRGIVISHQGKGRFLRTLPETEAVHIDESLSKNLERYSLIEVFEVRRALECTAMDLIAKHGTDEDIREIQQTYDKLKDQFHESKNTRGEFELHDMYAQKSKSNYLRQMLTTTRKVILDMMSSTFREILETHSIEKSIEAHDRIITALLERNGKQAKEVMYQHLQETIDMLEER